MRELPLISILMPARNAQKYLRLAVESILDQTFSDFELLILDDASDDKTFRIAQSLRDKRIFVKHFSIKQGLAKIRQAGVDLSRGKLIAFLDSDDISLPNRLKLQVKFFEKHEDVSILGSWTELIDDNGKRSGEIWKHITFPEYIKTFFLFRNCLTQSTVMIRRECFRKYGYRNGYWPAPDFDLWTRMSHEFIIANMPLVLSYYRVSDKNMTGIHEKEIEKCTQKIFADNLRYLGVNPGNKEVKLHDSLERMTVSGQAERMENLEVWLKRLINANTASKRYDIDILRKITGDYLFKTCLLNAEKGLKSWKKYRSSTLDKDAAGKWKKSAFLFMACAIHRPVLVDVSSQSWHDLVYGKKMPVMREQ